MKAQFLVTIEGNWLNGDKPVTAAQVETALREAVRNEFKYLAKRHTVKRIKSGAQDAAQEHSDKPDAGGAQPCG